MKLSIITINYNNVEGLRKTIDSVLCQTWKDFEWIFIDGGSTDGSKELIEKTAAECPYVTYWCSEPDKGIYNAMNKGIAKACGEYIQFLNSGDVFHKQDILECVTPSLYKYDIIYGNLQFVSEGSGETFIYPENLTLHYFCHRSIGHPASFIKSSLLKECGYREDFRIVSDWHRFFQWFLQGRKFKHINITISDFDTSGVSSSGNRELHEKERQLVYDELLNPQLRQFVDEIEQMQTSFEALNLPVLRASHEILKKRGLRLLLLRVVLRILSFK